MVAIGNPIRGFLHDNNWVRPPGNTDMRVTKTAAQHLPGPPALDIGDGNPDLDDILSPHAGIVAQALTFGSANLSIDFLSGGKKWRIVLAHNTLPHPVSVGQLVTEGQVVGRMGKTGATAIHLHIQLGYLDGTTWKWVDPWPLLRQNGAVDDEETDVLKGTNPRAIHNRKGPVLGNNTRVRSAPAIGDNILLELDAGAFIGPDYVVDGASVAGSVTWYGAWVLTPKGREFGYIHASTVGPLTPIEAGYSDADLNAAKKTAANVVSAAASAAASKF